MYLEEIDSLREENARLQENVCAPQFLFCAEARCCNV